VVEEKAAKERWSGVSSFAQTLPSGSMAETHSTGQKFGNITIFF